MMHIFNASSVIIMVFVIVIIIMIIIMIIMIIIIIIIIILPPPWRPEARPSAADKWSEKGEVLLRGGAQTVF